MERSRSRSPETKLHVSQLPLRTQQLDLERAFGEFGEVRSVKIIRNSSSGEPLRNSVYAFVVMVSHSAAELATSHLSSRGWHINRSREEKALPSCNSLQENYMSTMRMIWSNAKTPGFLERLIESMHPSAGNLPILHPSLAGCYMVREVWIGNISSTTDVKSLFDSFSQFGTIEDIEMFNSKGFAFVKFQKITQASLAYERAQGKLVDTRPVKIAFADPTRRIDIIGDSSSQDSVFDPTAFEHFKSLYVAYSAGVRIPAEPRLREVFARYGPVHGVHIEQAPTRPYVFVDYERGEDAATARIQLYIKDTEGRRRGELGDPRLEISFKNTKKSVNKNGNKNGVKFKDQGANVKEVAEKLLRNPHSVLPQLQQMAVPLLPPILTEPISVSAPVSRNQIEHEKTPHVVWSGFMTRNKKCKVGVDIAVVEGKDDCVPSNVYHLNVTHRVSFKEPLKFQHIAVLTLEASEPSQEEEFAKYILYFKGKQRAGFVQMKRAVLYVLPPSPEANQMCSQLKDKQLLGVLVNPVRKNN